MGKERRSEAFLKVLESIVEQLLETRETFSARAGDLGGC